MANSVTTKVITDGPRNATVKITGVLDTSDVTSTTVIDLSTLSPVSPTCRIYHIDYSISDQIELQLMWHATTNQVIMPLAGRGRLSFHEFGGLTNNAGAGKNGNIDLKTTGYGVGTQVFSLLLELVKEGVVGVGVR